MRALIARLRPALGTAPEPHRLAAVLWLCLLAAYYLHRAFTRDSLEPWERGLFVLCAAALPAPGWIRRLAAAVALGWFYAAGRLWEAPFSAANHEWFEAWLLAMLAAAPAGYGALRRLLMAATVTLIAWTGVQKVINGYYLPGDYFTVSLAQPSGKFAQPLMKRLEEPDRQRFMEFYREYRAHLDAGRPGVLDRPIPRLPAIDWASRAACWLTVLAELAGPVLLIPRRTRRPAALGLVLFFVGVEAVAHEWVFGALTGLLLVPFLVRRPPDTAGSPASSRSTAAPVALLALLAVWPCVQIALVRTLGLSPWKLAGFGMYSVPARFGAVEVEGRFDGDDTWVTLPAATPREERLRAGRGYVLRHAPFLRSAAAVIADAARDVAPEDRPEQVRVRSLTMIYDRGLDRFRLIEHTYEFP